MAPPATTPETMRCLQIDEWGGQLTAREIPVPSPEPTEVLLKVHATGVGRTVANVMEGNMNDDLEALPRIPGHEVVGEVVETGVGVTHLTVGDLATVYFHISCDHCRSCYAGTPALCENHGGWISAHTDGGFAEYACLPARNVLPLPADINPVDATVIPDAVATPYHVAADTGDIGTDDEVLVVGAGGGVGIHLVQVATHFGGRVTAVDIVDEKLAVCADLGAVETLNLTESSITDASGPYDVIVDFVGDTAILDQLPRLIGPRGRLVHLTTFPGTTTRVSPRLAVIKEFAVVGNRYCGKDDLLAAADLIADDIITPVVTETVGLEGVDELLDAVVTNEVVGRGAVTLD